MFAQYKTRPILFSTIFFLGTFLYCDGFDGALARKYKYNEKQKIYGVQLDSLSDVICFGCLPAVLTVAISNHIISYIIA